MTPSKLSIFYPIILYLASLLFTVFQLYWFRTDMRSNNYLYETSSLILPYLYLVYDYQLPVPCTYPTETKNTASCHFFIRWKLLPGLCSTKKKNCYRGDGVSTDVSGTVSEVFADDLLGLIAMYPYIQGWDQGWTILKQLFDPSLSVRIFVRIE